ncbi:MAG: hypothetical protein R3229_00410 [Alphaproteobacteria bacterium]|nr:hypothetical protein [Alphaproteobacteria bacterium]
MKALIVASASVLVLALAPGALARQPAPDALLSGEDRHRQEQALQNALEYNPIGAGAAWHNPATRHRGRVTPTRTFKNAAGMDCREYHRALIIDGRQAVGRGTRCRFRDGIWRVPRRVTTRGGYGRYRGSRYGARPYYPVTLHFGFFHGHHGHWHRRHRFHGHWRQRGWRYRH